MAGKVQFDLCPETGIGCVMLDGDSGLLKIDLMPDEAADLKGLLSAGDLDGAKAILAGVDPKAATEVDAAVLQELVKEVA